MRNLLICEVRTGYLESNHDIVVKVLVKRANEYRYMHA